MAPTTGTANLCLMKALLEQPHRFAFFQLLMLLQRYSGGAPLGRNGPVAEERIRLRPDLSLAFPTADVSSVEKAGSGEDRPRFLVTTALLGLYGVNSPLPTFYTEDLLWKETDQKTVRGFLDIFHHRILSLLFRCWEKYRYAVQYRPDGSDDFSLRMFCLAGLGSRERRAGTGLPAVHLLRYLGLITQTPHSASALSGILRDYFGLERAEITQCVERRVRVDPSQQNRLGRACCTLGRDCVLGGAVRDRTGMLAVAIGPLPLAGFLRFLPESEDYAAAVSLVRFWLRDPLDFHLRVTLRADEVPSARLSTTHPQRLGWTTWLTPSEHQDRSVVFRRPPSRSPGPIPPWKMPAGAHVRRTNRMTNPSARPL
jgi:type VI secretion system protein ImpH